MINQKFDVLDDGFVILRSVMGDDYWIDQCARHAEDTRDVDATTKLINYMMKHQHTSPFEFAEVCFHVRVPMDTWRQWIRHRTANVNEYSTRYKEAIDSCARTHYTKWRKQAKNNRQGSSDEFLNTYAGQHLSRRELDFHRQAEEIYQERLRMGVSREQARKDLPLSTYTEAYWKIDLHNFFHFLKLRADSHAQWEIRQYAQVMGAIVEQMFPITFAAWEEHVWGQKWAWSIPEIADIPSKVCSHINEYRQWAGLEELR